MGAAAKHKRSRHEPTANSKQQAASSKSGAPIKMFSRQSTRNYRSAMALNCSASLGVTVQHSCLSLITVAVLSEVTVKAKVTLEQAMKAQRENIGTGLLFL